MKQIIMPLY